MKSFKVFIALLSFGIFIASLANTEVVIERFQSDRDKEAIMKIIRKDAKYLAYEFIGYQEGTTEKYLMSSNYITDVLRAGDKTIGFVNYLYNNRTFFTFQLPVTGLIHLMGVDEDYRGKGYGKLLFNHAVSELEKCNAPQIFLYVNKNNKVAINLYKQAGFVNSIEELLAQDEKYRALEGFLDKMQQLVYTKRYDIDSDLLPKGNVIQRHSKKSLFAMVLIFSAAYKGFKYYKN